MRKLSKPIAVLLAMLLLLTLLVGCGTGSTQPSSQPTSSKEKRKNADEVHNFSDSVFLNCFIVGENKPYVLILPGGGYVNIAIGKEGNYIADKVNKLGYNAFVLNYSINENAAYPNTYKDVAAAINYITDNAARLKVNTEGYAVCGFSAGGHLAGTWCTKGVGYEQYELPKPKCAFLCYTAFSMEADSESKSPLYSKDNSEELMKKLNIMLNTDADYPKCFIMYGNKDEESIVQGSRQFKELLDELKIANEYHEYEGLGHGFGLGEGTVAEGWIKQAIDFWQKSE